MQNFRGITCYDKFISFFETFAFFHPSLERRMETSQKLHAIIFINRGRHRDNCQMFSILQLKSKLISIATNRFLMVAMIYTLATLANRVHFPAHAAPSVDENEAPCAVTTRETFHARKGGKPILDVKNGSFWEWHYEPATNTVILYQESPTNITN